ncbi:DUF4197 family protein [Elizabethkingia sp. JS20170427COW]|uniref:DUF4197 family protein n=1 Tax=Elizabethkingia sp. JS20170427COW TaxID=2583851 RepID=UPI001110EF93|nr:DUF4197 family protein [Elizabethkingia sp. JS20170427COW]QCX54151.1 DUF4197 domain-containing protein [Elizabethkingia sp. JS20170427COW]
MKKIILPLVVASAAVVSVSSCSTTGVNNPMGVGALQNLLLNASNKGFGILSNPQEFLTNTLIDAALPDELKKINNTLTSLGMDNLVKKEKQYIAEAAKMTVTAAKPVVTQAIKEMTITDAIAIAAGGKGAATQYLKEKTKDKLVLAMQPQVEAKLNEVGIVKTLNTALSAGSASGILGTLLGKNDNNQVNTVSPISKLAAQQMVNGLFFIMENYETENKLNPSASGFNK